MHEKNELPILIKSLYLFLLTKRCVLRLAGAPLCALKKCCSANVNVMGSL